MASRKCWRAQGPSRSWHPVGMQLMLLGWAQSVNYGSQAWYSVTPNSFSISQLPLKQSLIICGTMGCMFVAEMGLLFFFFNFLIIYLLVVLGLCCCTWAFSSCGEQGLLFWASHGGGFSHCGAPILGPWASVAAPHRLWLLCGMWNLSGPGIEPACPVLGSRFLIYCTTREVLGLTFKSWFQGLPLEL